jgi:hypothetical protein
MKNDIKKYLTIGAALAGSAFMVSCDGDSVSVLQDTGVADAITDAIGDKPVAPIKIAEFPVTSLKLAFESTAGTCIGAAFTAGEEYEIDFDSTTVTTADQTTGNAQADGVEDDNINFGEDTEDIFIEGITADPALATWTIDFVKEGTDTTGTILLSDLTFTPLASDQRSVTGRFTATAPVDVNFNQDAANVVGSDSAPITQTLLLPNGGTANIDSVAVYENFGGNDVEVISTDGTSQFETSIGDDNYGLSFGASDGCVYNFVLNQTAVNTAVTGGRLEIINGINNPEAGQLLAIVNFLNQLDVSAAGNQISNPEADVRYLTAGTSTTGVSGSYRHDYDSSTGTVESSINSSNIVPVP